ncbi:hypothetical protein [Hymenobacter metallicola]|nr:hypothetical protein [Hymenobacter metallicola]
MKNGNSRPALRPATRELVQRFAVGAVLCAVLYILWSMLHFPIRPLW